MPKSFMMQPLEKHFLTWEEATQTDATLVGGKGWNLSRLAKYGFPIPVGGILTTEAYRQFVIDNQLTETIESISQTLTNDNLDEYDNTLTRLRKQIRSGSLPQSVLAELVRELNEMGLINKAVAVRSSASAEDSCQASFAGIHDSYLNVIGWENILEAIKACYASLWTPRAVAYRRRLNIADSDVLPAVVIMEMVEAQSAGVAFTCEPQTGRPDLFVIHANFGLGESVVSGSIEPDTYYLDNSAFKAGPALISKKIGTKQMITKPNARGGTYCCKSSENLAVQPVLSDTDIERLGLLLLRVFEALGDGEQQQDVEWAFDGQNFIMLQARPVTALPLYTFEALKNKPAIWSNGNYREAIPMVLSPLHRRLMKHIIDTIQYTCFSKTGYDMPAGFQFSRLFKGRLYCNISALQWAYYDSTGMLPRDFTPFWGGHQPEIEIDDPAPFQGEAGLARQHRAAQGGSLIMEAAANASSIFAEVARSVAAINEKGFGSLPDRDFIAQYNALGQIVHDYCEKFTFLSGVGTWPLMMLLQKLSGYLGPRVMIVLNGLMIGGESAITSADHGYRLIELAELARQDPAAVQYLTGRPFDALAWETQLPESSPFRQSFRDFIKTYGYRAVYELDIINPRWQEDPSYPLEIIRSTLNTADLGQWKAGQKEKFDQAWREIADKVPLAEQPAIRQGIKEAQEGAAVREMTKAVLVMALQSYRTMAQEIGNRLSRRGVIAESDDVFFCSWSELFSILDGQWNGHGLAELVADRKAAHREKESIPAPDVLLGEEPVFSSPLIQGDNDYLQGVGAAAGKAAGTARLINHPGEGNRLQAGDVLVAPSTDPGWTPLFLKACAVVMETGGFLSHGAIVAREYGVPAVVNVPGVMRVLKDGQKIIVDGDEGRIYQDKD